MSCLREQVRPGLAAVEEREVMATVGGRLRDVAADDQDAHQRAAGRTASWAVMVSAGGKVSPTSVTCFQRSSPSASMTKTDRRSPAPPSVMPYSRLTVRPSSASSGKARWYLRANASWLASPCGLMAQTVAPKPVKLSRPEVYEHSCRVHTAVL